MRRRPKALAWGVAFAQLNLSCVAHTTKPVAPKTLNPDKKVEILGATGTSGERFEYPVNTPAIVKNGELCATEAWRVELHVLPRGEIKEPYPLGKSRPDRIVTTDGRTYKPSRLVSVSDQEVRFETRVAVARPVIEVRKTDVASRSFGEGGKIKGLRMKTGLEYRDVEVVGEDESTLRLTARGQEACTPLAEYQQLAIRKVSAGKTALSIIGGLALAWAVAVGIYMATPGPMYSFDGEQYVFDAEP